MSLFRKTISAAFAASLFAASIVAAPAVRAQELSAEHVQIAIEVVRSAGASRGFDNVLPILAGQVTDRLIRVRPDLHKQITAAVEAVAIKLAVRRAELDGEIARIWAKFFTVEELQSLLAFYQSPAGKKFVDVGPQTVAESFQVVDRWSQRVGEELLEKTREELRTQGIDIGG